MKRVSSACLYQTLHFILDPALPSTEAKTRVQTEVSTYKNSSQDSIQILKEDTLEDGSIVLSVRKKVSGYPIGTYFD